MGSGDLIIFVLLCFVPACAISAIVTEFVRRRAPDWGLIDQPAARKVHVTPTPLGGGIGVWAGVVLPLIVATAGAWWFRGGGGSIPAWLPDDLAVHIDGVLHRSGTLWAILAGATILSVMGLLDDLVNLPWLPRLIVQFCVAGGLVAAGVQATVFAPVPALGMLITLLWILVLTNSFNFLDNMDGLSSGIGLIAAILFAAVMLSAGDQPRVLVGGMMLILAGSLSGFLMHNWPPARIFMGDSGSYFIGMLLASMTVVGTFYEGTGSRHVILAPLCILAVPLYDFCSVMVIRLREGRSPFHPDKSHFSHRLVELGLPPQRAVLTIYLATLTTGLGALLLYHVRGWSGALLIVAFIGCVLAIIAILETAGRNNRRPPDESGG